MAKLTLAQSFEAIEVDLFGHDFETRNVTRTTQLQLAELEQLAEQATESQDVDKMVEALAKVLDLRLKAADGKRTKPSTIIQQRWQADELNILELVKFVEELGAASAPR